jgi:hypothetical protein
MSCNVWSCPEAAIIGPGFSRLRASNLHKASLCKDCDIMRGSGFVSAAEAQGGFGLKKEERRAWEAATQTMSRRWQSILSTPQGRTNIGEWLGVY